ncbi:DUF2947 domain-containing protein [Shewanella sp. A32]|uniref:DUF2947 domain-containing protein n=1 Tax=Shewanella sp. A32 TaxID=3031327 RepID=UPI0023B99B4A|nr:DUF2947 domain-containing protein [Shewanella sp. A32]MDF0532933.1 DUF2947 domain-containing protein [Shewanella sp. A32]
MSYSYIPLAEYRRKWIFSHHEMPVSEKEKADILPLTSKSAMELWNCWISNKSSCAEQFTKGDWADRKSTWHHTDNWQSQWDSEQPDLPEALAQFIPWADDTRVYFCIEKYEVIETSWATFKQHWKCFLFCDDGPLLISNQHRQAVWFSQDGNYRLGLRS